VRRLIIKAYTIDEQLVVQLFTLVSSSLFGFDFNQGGAHIAVIATSFCVGTIIDSCIEILYNRFCIERSSKMRFLGDFGGRGEGIWRESISVLRIAHFQTSFVQI